MRYRLKALFYLMTLVAFVAWWFPRNSIRILEGGGATLYVESILPIDWIEETGVPNAIQASYSSPCEAIVYGKPAKLTITTLLGKTHFKGPPYRVIGHSGH